MKVSNYIKKLLGALLLSSVSMMSYAGTASNSNIFYIHYFSNGIVVFYINGTRADTPGCAASQPMRFALNSTTAGGKNQLAGLLTAYTSNKKINIFGYGTCNFNGVEEDMSYFYTSD